MVLCRVLLLEGNDYELQVDEKATGQVVFDKICEHLNLLEKDYFGFTFRAKDAKLWLRLDKKIGKQIVGAWILTFVVKYYPPNPAVLREEFTRYLLFLQLRTDIIGGRLPCSFISEALLGSYAIQSQIGDYDEDEFDNNIDYLKGITFSQNQGDELLEKIIELHKTHRGDSPAVAEMAYLENAKNLAMYGVHMHPVKEEGGADGLVSIGVCAIGLLLYKDRLRTNRFCWAKLIKISYKRDKFFIKVRAEENEKKGVKLTYKARDIPQAQKLWRIAMEHHTFFRMREAEAVSRSAFSRAGGYTFTGRTYYQAQMASNGIHREGLNFTRAASTRFASSRSLNALTTGYATEREEKHIAEGMHPAATLNLKKGLGSHSSIPYGDYNVDDPFGADGYGLIAGRMVDQYGRPINPDPNANQGYPMGYGQPPDPYYEEFNEAGGPRAEGAAGYMNGYGGRPNGSNWSSRSGSVASGISSTNPLRNPHMLQPTRDVYGNIIVVKNQNRMNDSMTSSQDDRLTEQRYGPGMSEDGAWNQAGAMGIPKTSKRTYTTPNGTIITEYRTETNGVVETRIEKRTRQMTDYEDIDYDEALAQAIRAVTDMNPDLAVEKIEIHTKAEETMA